MPGSANASSTTEIDRNERSFAEYPVCVERPTYKEIERRTDLFGTFPNPAALLGLAGHVLIEQYDEWDGADRRYLSEQSVALLLAEPAELAIPELTAA